MEVSLIPTDHVEQVWHKVVRFADMAAEYTFGRYTTDDIKDSITQDNHDLWVAFDGDVVKGMVVTNFIHYPQLYCLAMQFVAGDEGPSWKAPMLKLLQKWACDNHCDRIESSGRSGWSRIFKDDGYKMLWQVYELPVAEVGLGDDNGCR